MPTKTAHLDRPYRVGVVRALPGLGDFLCSVPALRALRGALPFARIDLIGLPAVRPLVQRYSHYVDALVPFPGYPGIPEVTVDMGRLTQFAEMMRHDPYDLLIQMHGDGSHMNDFCLALGSRQVFGYHPAGTVSPDPGRFLPYPSDEPEVLRNLRLAGHVGAPSRGTHLEFPLRVLDAAELAGIPEAAELEHGRYAVIHPGASGGGKRWSPEHFALVADHLATQGLMPVLTGVVAESALCATVAAEMEYESFDLSGRTSLGALAALVAGSALIVANDTGISHLADALAVPSVVVFSGSSAQRWAPLDRSRHRIVELPPGDGACAPSLATLLEAGSAEAVQAAADMQITGVLAAVEHVLSRGGAGVS